MIMEKSGRYIIWNLSFNRSFNNISFIFGPSHNNNFFGIFNRIYTHCYGSFWYIIHSIKWFWFLRIYTYISSCLYNAKPELLVSKHIDISLCHQILKAKCAFGYLAKVKMLIKNKHDTIKYRHILPIEFRYITFSIYVNVSISVKKRNGTNLFFQICKQDEQKIFTKISVFKPHSLF